MGGEKWLGRSQSRGVALFRYLEAGLGSEGQSTKKRERENDKNKNMKKRRKKGGKGKEKIYKKKHE